LASLNAYLLSLSIFLDQHPPDKRIAHTILKQHKLTSQ
jgi:hypothetical protein